MSRSRHPREKGTPLAGRRWHRRNARKGALDLPPRDRRRAAEGTWNGELEAEDVRDGDYVASAVLAEIDAKERHHRGRRRSYLERAVQKYIRDAVPSNTYIGASAVWQHALAASIRRFRKLLKSELANRRGVFASSPPRPCGRGDRA